jgi:ABC-type Fe3+/spermidine/putrescine transport system ATPase subunit
MSDNGSSKAVELRGVAKSFGNFRAVDRLDLAIRAGEFFSLLGPSGCGKTTTLRLIAGFENPDEGKILVGGDDITHVPVHRRNMGMIFQSYALFPHRTVAQNVGFGLRMRGLGKAELRERVAEALSLVSLSGLGERYPNQLSGGQQQRVSFARAMVIRPPVLLCDEPFSALDRKLRQQMQYEIKKLQDQLGMTLIFVTHDQEEAMTMSDRIAVMSEGRIEQTGSPREIYDTPRTSFVADFIGDNNLLSPELAKRAAVSGDPRANALRPEKVTVVPPGSGLIDGIVRDASFTGGHVLYRVETPDGFTLLAKEMNPGAAASWQVGHNVGLAWKATDTVALES